MRASLAVVLLVAVALFGAPSAVFGANNALRAAEVSPRTGTVATDFAFRVTYEGRFAATVVRVLVGPVSLPMGRVSGSGTSGTWAATARLGPGTWPVTFVATTVQGNAPTLAAGSVSVAGGAAATPVPTDGRSPDLPGPIATPAPSVAPAPVTPAPASPTAAPGVPGSSSAAVASDDPGLAPAASGGGGSTASAVPVVPGAPGSGDGAPAAPPGGPGPSASGDAVAAPTGFAGAGPSSDRSPDTIGRGAPGAGLDGLLGRDGPLAGVAGGPALGIAAIALVGVLFLLAARRRRSGATIGGESRPAPEAGAGADLDAVLDRRTRRRARVRLDEDPIIAAMDLGASHERQPRRGRVTGGSAVDAPGDR